MTSRLSTADRVIGAGVAVVTGALVTVAAVEAGAGAATAVAVAAVGLPATVAGVAATAGRMVRADRADDGREWT